MPESTTFELGKTALAFPINEQFDGVLFGRTVQGEDSCNLYLVYKKVRAGTDTLDGKEKILGHYQARSAMFKSGEHTDADARRYLKSRYREMLREINSIGEGDGSGQAKHDKISDLSKDFIRTNRESTSEATIEPETNSEPSVESETAPVTVESTLEFEPTSDSNPSHEPVGSGNDINEA